MGTCGVCGEWLIYKYHDCGPALRRRDEQRAREEQYAEVRLLHQQREAKTRKRRILALSAVAALGLAGIGIANIVGQDEKTDRGNVAISSPGMESRTSPAPAYSESDSVIDAELQRYGVTRKLLDELNVEAAISGYSINRSVPMSKTMLTNFAFAMISICEDVQLGETNWGREMSRDISDGAPRNDAARMHQFL